MPLVDIAMHTSYIIKSARPGKISKTSIFSLKITIQFSIRFLFLALVCQCKEKSKSRLLIFYKHVQLSIWYSFSIQHRVVRYKFYILCLNFIFFLASKAAYLFLLTFRCSLISYNNSFQSFLHKSPYRENLRQSCCIWICKRHGVHEREINVELLWEIVVKHLWDVLVRKTPLWNIQRICTEERTKNKEQTCATDIIATCCTKVMFAIEVRISRDIFYENVEIC